jgi:hypothetical protein
VSEERSAGPASGGANTKAGANTSTNTSGGANASGRAKTSGGEARGSGESPGTEPKAPKLSRRVRREQLTVEIMIRMYCGVHHAQPAITATERGGDLCPDCQALLDYSNVRVEKCRFGADKPVCACCTVHCYRPEMREQIRTVMRYSGPRMTWRHTSLAVRHLLDRRRALAGRA